MKILYIVFIAIFTYLLLALVIECIIVKIYLGFIPANWRIELDNNKRMIIHHNGLKESFCIDEGDRVIDFHDSIKVNMLVVILLKIF